MTDASPKELLEKAESQAKSGNIAMAIGLYRQIPYNAPQSRKARRALKSLQKGNPSAVMEADLKELLRVHEQKSSKQAMSLARQLNRNYPDQPLPCNIIGTVQMERGQIQDAIKYFLRALDMAPDFHDAGNNLGAAYNALKDYDKALACLNRVVAARPQDPRALANLGKAYSGIRNHEAAVRSYESSLRIRPADINTLLGLGQALLNLRQYDEAASYLLRVIEIKPETSQAYYKLGQIALQTGNRKQAVEYFCKALKLAPGSPEIEHFLAVAEGDASGTAPAQYVASIFDGYANNFDEHLVETLKYDVPQLLHQLVSESGALPGRVGTAIDLGCGTGLCGEHFRGNCDYLVGVDLSTNMIERARSKELYDDLVVDDIVSFINGMDKSYDLFISADTFIYVGELTEVFRAVAGHANPGALFAFSTESGPEQDVALLETGRYSHSHNYIQRVSTEAGFKLVSYRQQNLRQDRGEWLEGGYYLLQFEG